MLQNYFHLIPALLIYPVLASCEHLQSSLIFGVEANPTQGQHLKMAHSVRVCLWQALN
jgi:hypothetical protein